MPDQRTLEFANFICRFGDYELLDLAQEVVIPAFLSGDMRRTYGEDSYFFRNVSLIALGNSIDDYAIAGRFVKSTKYVRQQYFDHAQDEIVQDPLVLPDAPTAIFLLVLNTHKLAYLHETKAAPSIYTFAKTAENIIRQQWQRYLNNIYLGSEPLPEFTSPPSRVSKTWLTAAIPRPTVECVPIADEASFAEFVARYGLLKSAVIRLVRPNREPDNNGLFPPLRTTSDRVNSEQTKLIFTNNKGLSKTETVTELTPIVEDANAIVDLNGTDPNGATLKGNNTHFQIRRRVQVTSTVVEEVAVELYSEYRSALPTPSSGRRPSIPERLKRFIQGIINGHE